jgi:hypothetical protein
MVASGGSALPKRKCLRSLLSLQDGTQLRTLIGDRDILGSAIGILDSLPMVRVGHHSFAGCWCPTRSYNDGELL